VYGDATVRRWVNVLGFRRSECRVLWRQDRMSGNPGAVRGSITPRLNQLSPHSRLLLATRLREPLRDKSTEESAVREASPSPRPFHARVSPNLATLFSGDHPSAMLGLQRPKSVPVESEVLW